MWMQVCLEVWQGVTVIFFSDGFNFLCDVLEINYLWELHEAG